MRLYIVAIMLLLSLPKAVQACGNSPKEVYENYRNAVDDRNGQLVVNCIDKRILPIHKRNVVELSTLEDVGYVSEVYKMALKKMGDLESIQELDPEEFYVEFFTSLFSFLTNEEPGEKRNNSYIGVVEDGDLVHVLYQMHNVDVFSEPWAVPKVMTMAKIGNEYKIITSEF